MVLRSAENQCFLALIDRFHEQLYTEFFPLGYFDNAVEVAFRVALSIFNFAGNQFVITGINIVVERGSNLLHFEGRQEAVVDAILERVNVTRLAEVGIGIDVGIALGSGA